MSKYDDFLLEVGDEFEGSSSEATRFISEVKAVGGSVKILGKRVIITDLPDHLKKKNRVQPVVKTVAPKVEKSEEEFKVEEPKVEESKVEETAEEITEEVKPKRRRSRKFLTEEAEETEE